MSSLEGEILSDVLKSFSFGVYRGYSEIPPSVWGLFVDMAKDTSKSVPYVSEIVSAGLEGRIATNMPFHLDAYCKAIEMNTRLADYSRARKVAYCVNDEADDFETTSRAYGTISLSKVSLVAKMEDSFEKLADSDELRYAVSQIRSLNESFILEHSVNIIETLKYAVRGVPSAIERLRQLCSDFSEVAEYVQVILGSGENVEECFA